MRELNENLVALGYTTSSEVEGDWSYFSAETKSALERLQYHLGEEETGSLTEGQAVFLPGQVRISTVNATLGTSAGPGAAVMQATSDSQQVVVNLDASEQSEVKVGDDVQITLPDGQTTPGVVSSIGTVLASSSANSSSGSGSSSPTLPLYITLKHPKAAGDLDQAPVTVEITTAAVKHALIVPIDALLALSAAAMRSRPSERTGFTSSWLCPSGRLMTPPGPCKSPAMCRLASGSWCPTYEQPADIPHNRGRSRAHRPAGVRRLPDGRERRPPGGTGAARGHQDLRLRAAGPALCVA